MKSFVVIRRKEYVIRADYEGGAYIDLTFGGGRGLVAYKPTEVINVWDDETNKPVGVLETWEEQTTEIAQAILRSFVGDWISKTAAEWPEWFEGYIENASY